MISDNFSSPHNQPKPYPPTTLLACSVYILQGPPASLITLFSAQTRRRRRRRRHPRKKDRMSWWCCCAVKGELFFFAMPLSTPLSHIAAAVTVTFAKRRLRRYTTQVGPPPAPSAVIRNTQFFPNLRKITPGALQPPLLFPVFSRNLYSKDNLTNACQREMKIKLLCRSTAATQKDSLAVNTHCSLAKIKNNFPFPPFCRWHMGNWCMWVEGRSGGHSVRNTRMQSYYAQDMEILFVWRRGVSRGCCCFSFCVSEQAGRGGVR